mmetsp:Transcript_26463/g.48713  ORF Transcript_26463/g.48713 Transcript_26463/m.48713 type:complete len:101 (+) Transcript_26463:461-763(+)
MFAGVLKGTTFIRNGLEEAGWESAGVDDDDSGAGAEVCACADFAAARANTVFGDVRGFINGVEALELGVPFGVETLELQSERRPRVFMGIRALGRGPGGA